MTWLLPQTMNNILVSLVATVEDFEVDPFQQCFLRAQARTNEVNIAVL